MRTFLATIITVCSTLLIAGLGYSQEPARTGAFLALVAKNRAYAGSENNKVVKLRIHGSANDKDILEAVPDPETIESLSMGPKDFLNGEFEQLAKFVNLKELYLGYTNLTDKDAVFLDRLQKLEKLHLQGT